VSAGRIEIVLADGVRSLVDRGERSAVLQQLELQLADMEEDASQAEAAAQMAATTPASANITVAALERAQAGAPAIAEAPAARARSLSVPSACPWCGGVLHKLGEDVTETPRQ
jgi:transposase